MLVRDLQVFSSDVLVPQEYCFYIVTSAVSSILTASFQIYLKIWEVESLLELSSLIHVICVIYMILCVIFDPCTVLRTKPLNIGL